MFIHFEYASELSAQGSKSAFNDDILALILLHHTFQGFGTDWVLDFHSSFLHRAPYPSHYPLIGETRHLAMR